MQYSEEKINKILQERATKLAVSEQTKEMASAEKILELVLVEIEKEVFGFEQQYVKEVVSLRNMATIPGLPPFISGIIYHRGKVVAVNSLAHLFDFDVLPEDQNQKVLIAGDKEMLMGIVVNNISGTAVVPVEDIQQELPNMSDFQKEVTIGLLSTGESLVSLKKLLSHPKLILK